MKKSETINRKKEITADIICDMCGDSCMTDNGVINNPVRMDHGEPYYSFDYLEIKGHFGFYSNDKDGETWTAHICESCSEKLDKMIIFNKVDEFSGSRTRELEKTQERKRKIRDVKNNKKV